MNESGISNIMKNRGEYVLLVVSGKACSKIYCDLGYIIYFEKGYNSDIQQKNVDKYCKDTNVGGNEI